MGLSQNRCDVFIVGGGPAGLTAAITLRQRGVHVLLADAQVPPIDKACGEGIMPDSRRELAHLGVDLASSHGTPFRGIRFCDELSTASANFTAGSFSGSDFPGEGIGLRRLVLHGLFVDRARDLGVRMRWGVPVALAPNQPPSLAGEPVTYRYLIGADGQSSRVRFWAGLDRGTLHSRRLGFRTHYRTRPWSQYVEVHWGPLGQAYVTPIGENEICVAAVTRFPGLARTTQLIDSIPALRTRLRHAEITSRERGSITTTRTLRHVVRGNLALLGDASGSADAVTGEGLAVVFRQAALLADSIASGGLAAYAAAHARTLRLPQAMARALLFLDRHPALRRKALQVFAHEPALFEKLLRVHLGEEPLTRLLFSHAPRLGARMLLPLPLRP